jgi:hypothetical protein
MAAHRVICNVMTGPCPTARLPIFHANPNASRPARLLAVAEGLSYKCKSKILTILTDFSCNFAKKSGKTWELKLEVRSELSLSQKEGAQTLLLHLSRGKKRGRSAESTQSLPRPWKNPEENTLPLHMFTCCCVRTILLNIGPWTKKRMIIY